MKSTLVLAAGCLVAAMAVGDTVYRIAPRAGVSYPVVEVAKASVGDTSDLTDQDDETMNSDLDSLFANATDGLDPAELASVRELASIAKPHSSHWGDDFFKEGVSGVGNCSDFTLKNVTGCWDPTLDRIARADNSPKGSWGPGTGDEYCLAPTVTNGRFYGGGTDSAYATRHHHSPSHIASQYCPPSSVPEPSSLGLILLGGVGLLKRRKAK